MLTLLFSIAVMAATVSPNTPKYWQCANPVSGSWFVGIAPIACDSNVFGDDRHVRLHYSQINFDLSRNEEVERQRYSQELYAVLRDAARYYINKRTPGATAEEQQVFIRAFLAVAYQESLWSHWRLEPAQRLKHMRGDYGHGHGLLQVDDRAHFKEIEEGKGWELIEHFKYGLDLYFEGWTLAVGSSCVRDGDVVARARSAYSVYNGGVNSLCRWTNPNSPWAANDRGFYSKYESRPWEAHVADLSAPAPFDVVCYMEGNSNCTHRGMPTSPSTWILGDERVCLEQGACVSDLRDVSCLSSETFSWQKTRYSPDAGTQQELLDRHQVCPKKFSGTPKVGSLWKIGINLNVRKHRFTPATETLKAGQIVQVLDFEWFNEETKSQVDATLLVAGEVRYVRNWKSASHSAVFSSRTLRWIAQVGDSIRVLVDGQLLRTTPGGAAIGKLKKGASLKVLEVQVRGSNNEVYYLVQASGIKGYAFGGRFLPEPNFKKWFGVL